ncbi:ATP-dependent 6-phosphofructokinase [Verrucomicrobia bacterium LW23]|nr:ATP-dependent 6-phosphofructokinase [Verrucomicrobia bacterium LW23]
MSELKAADLIIRSLGERTITSPLEKFFSQMGSDHAFYEDDNRIAVYHRLGKIMQGDEIPCFESAGPRRNIYFKPSEVKIGIITCGGICPGLNDVIRALFMQAHYRYGVPEVYGIPYGYEGLVPEFGHRLIKLTPEYVSSIHTFGGTAIGTSRGPQSVKVMVDRLQEIGINMLFVIGGDGSQRGAMAIEAEATSRGCKMVVVGVPKTIDNDLIYMDKSFGYETACAAAVNAIQSAHTEARSARNGVGLVKLMGRHSGFIASSAAIASGDVNCVLIPETPFVLEGDNGLLEYIRQRVNKRHHAVVIVAEGAGQELFQKSGVTDASGNTKLHDIGTFLKGQIEDYFRKCKTELNLKYIDPSYIIRSVAASPQDRIYCMRLGQAAVHAAMAGKTGLVVARWHGAYVHVPMNVVTSRRRTVDPGGDLWLSVLESTGQPARFF